MTELSPAYSTAASVSHDHLLLQGSVVTCLRRGEIFKHEFVANLLRSPSVEKYENRSIFGEVVGTSLVSCFF